MRNFLNLLLTVCWASSAQANIIEEQVNQAIPDGDASGLASSLHLTGISDPIVSLQVNLNLSGTYNGDLYAYLVHDGGFSVLLNRVGRTSNNDLGYGDGGFNVTFFDGAANGDIHNYRSSLFGNASTPLSGPLTGNWSPDGRQSSPFGVTDADARTALLSSFDGLDPNGDWTLFVADLSGGDLHQLDSWGLEFGAPVPSVPENGSTATWLLTALAGVALAARYWSAQRRGQEVESP
jgi:subtilisin-like proprotein convertase family protein